MRPLKDDAPAGKAAKWLADAVSPCIDELEGLVIPDPGSIYGGLPPVYQMPYRRLEADLKRASECFDSIRILAKGDRWIDASALVRVLVDVVVKSIWLVHREDGESEGYSWEKWCTRVWYRRDAALQFIQAKADITTLNDVGSIEVNSDNTDPVYYRDLLENKDELDNALKDARYTKQIFKNKSNGLKVPLPRKMAREVDLTIVYACVYRMSSGAVHYDSTYAFEASDGPFGVSQQEKSDSILRNAIIVYGLFLERADSMLDVGFSEMITPAEAWIRKALARTSGL